MDARSSTSSSELGAAYLRAVAFLVPLLAIIWAAGLVCARAFPDANQLKYQAMFEPGARQPNVIVGSSVAAYGIDPHYLERPGAPYFNYAFNGAGPLFIADWYQQLRAQQGPPATVIYSIEWFSLEVISEGVRKLPYDYVYFPFPRMLGYLWQGQVSVLSATGQVFPLFSRNEAIQDWLFHQASPLTIEYARYYHGFVPLNSETDQMTPHLSKMRHAHYNPQALAAFRDGLAAMQRDGVRVIVVHPPLYTPMTGDHPEEEALIGAIARSHHLPFLDYAGPLGAAITHDRSLFVDDRHLNERGSQRFSRQLGDDLRARSLI